LFQEVNAEEQQRLRKLSAMYGKMEPEQAAKILDGLDKQLAVEILSGIKDKSAGRILASMDQKRAAQLTRGISKITPY
jgi:flagellar motility protein MotE (MotC chaperone)